MVVKEEGKMWWLDGLSDNMSDKIIININEETYTNESDDDAHLEGVNAELLMLVFNINMENICLKIWESYMPW